MGARCHRPGQKPTPEERHKAMLRSGWHGAAPALDAKTAPSWSAHVRGIERSKLLGVAHGEAAQQAILADGVLAEAPQRRRVGVDCHAAPLLANQPVDVVRSEAERLTGTNRADPMLAADAWAGLADGSAHDTNCA